MRRNPTRAEAKMCEILYQTLSSQYPEHVFYSQSVNSGYILDFYCPTLRLAIEVDGSIHEGREEYDRHRDIVLYRKNIQVFHFGNCDVLNNPQNVTFQLSQIIQSQKSIYKQNACFIATAAYGTATAKELNDLRKFRDITLKSNLVGSKLVDLYYFVSPPIANIIAGRKEMRAFVRRCLDPIINSLKRKGY